MFLVLWLAGLVVATATGEGGIIACPREFCLLVTVKSVCCLLVTSDLSHVPTGDAACSLQKRASTLPLQRDSDVRRASMHDLWSTPGLGFRQCPKQPQVEVEALQIASVASELMNLTEKPQCPPGEVLIGNFQQDSYEFSCCSGPQCQGCRSVDDGVCQECAAGYVMQTIPVLNQSKCFICDDVPGWHDMKGRSCTDLEKQGICNGAWPKEDLAYQGVKPSEACCACGGGSVYPTPVVMDFADKALYFGQEVDDTPQPMSETQDLGKNQDVLSWLWWTSH